VAFLFEQDGINEQLNELTSHPNAIISNYADHLLQSHFTYCLEQDEPMEGYEPMEQVG